MFRKTITWKGLIYYGEVFGFLLAWTVVFAVATQQSPHSAEAPGYDRVAVFDPMATPPSLNAE